MTINQLNITDLEAAWEIEQAAHAFPWSKTQLTHQLQKNGVNFAYREKQQLYGIACLQLIMPEAEILNIAIHPTHQGKGFGKRLLTQLIAQLKQEGFERIYLEVRASNQTAINLYERLGFNQIGERRHYYPALKGREDALLYAIEL